ncbi:MAG: DNA ligase [Pseudomonadota bacterium]
MVTLTPLAGALLALTLVASPVISAEQETPALLLAAPYHAAIDPAGYWVSEKLDGVRAYWDGNQLLFRSGRPVPAPAWFTRDLPPQPLDGELWLGRGRFEPLSGIVRSRTPVDADWQQVRFMLFELPGAIGAFSERQARLASLVDALGIPWVQAVEQVRVADHANLMARLDAVVRAGGEGLMLHRAEAVYRAGRGEDLLKLKPALDREARVVGHVTGKGRLAGRLGALVVEDAEGRRFRIGSGFSDAERDQPPAVGAWVTYRYRGLTSTGLPRFPTYLREHVEF